MCCPFFRRANTPIFGRAQRIDSMKIIFCIRELRSTLEFSFFTVSPKVFGEVVVGSGQNKNLLWELRPLDESAPSARKITRSCRARQGAPKAIERTGESQSNRLSKCTATWAVWIVLFNTSWDFAADLSIRTVF